MSFSVMFIDSEMSLSHLQVLATDNAKHMSLLAALKTMVETKIVAGKHLVLDSFQDRLHVSGSSLHFSFSLSLSVLYAQVAN